MPPSTAAMPKAGDKLSGAATTTAAVIAFTWFFALAISIRLIKHLIVNKKRVLADNSYSQFKHLNLHASDLQAEEECTNLHPYKGEISSLIKNPIVEILECLNGDDYDCGGSKMGRSFVWVDSEKGWRELVEVLSEVRVQWILSNTTPGHGPHGKQVVEYLLKEYGADGINQFWQRWRQVFVEALHPRFLPAGWDVMHSTDRFYTTRVTFAETNHGTAFNLRIHFTEGLENVVAYLFVLRS